MLLKSAEVNLQDEIKQCFMAAWHAGREQEASDCYLMLADDAVAIALPEAFYQIELKIAQQSGTNTEMLNEYFSERLSGIAEEIGPLIEKLTGHRILYSFPLIDLHAGWMVGFFMLEVNHIFKNKDRMNHGN